MSSVSLKKINSPTLCFFIGLVVWQFGQMLNLSSFDSIYAVTGIIEKVLEIFGLTLIVFSQFMVGKLCFFKNKVIVTFIILFYFIFNNGLLAKDMTIVTICLILFCTNGIDLDKVISNYFWIRIIYFSFIIFLSLVNVLPNVVTYRAEGSPRYNLGFFWTSFSAYSFFFCILYLIWTNKKISNFYLIIITFINQLFFELTNTKTAYFLSLLAIVVLLLQKKHNFKSKFLKKILFFSALILPSLFFFVSYYYAKNAFAYPSLNEIMTNRLYLGYEGLQKFGVKMYGQVYVETIANRSIIDNYFTIDSSLLRYIVHYGWISTIIFSALFTKLILFFVKKNQLNKSIVLILVLLSALTDPWLLALDFNVFILYFSRLFMAPSESAQMVKKI